MTNIEKTIQTKYGIDIKKENVLKLYKVNAAMSDAELENCIAETRKKWQISINGSNEKFAERDRKYLEKAHIYEQILRDASLRKALFQYYENTKSSSGVSEQAKDFFAIIAKTRKLKKKDYEFFVSYYPEQKRNKKAILEMLQAEYKVHFHDKNEEDSAEQEDTEGKKKNPNSILITNAFQEATLLKIHKCCEYYQNATTDKSLYIEFPELGQSLYNLLQLDKISNIEEAQKYIKKRREEVYYLRQEKGASYLPIVDIFNNMADIMEYSDVVDNYEEMKLLIRYEKLTPYMYCLNEVKENTLNALFQKALDIYGFRDRNDFLLNYFNLIYDNFQIETSSIRKIMKGADARAKSNAFLNYWSELLGLRGDSKQPFYMYILYGLVYWPIYVVYFVFELFHILFTKAHKAKYAILGVGVVVTNVYFPKIFGIENMLMLSKIFNREKWNEVLIYYFEDEITNRFVNVLESLYVFALLFLEYVAPAIIVAFVIYSFSIMLEESLDWRGYQRTFQVMFQQLWIKNQMQFFENKKRAIKKYVGEALFSIFLVALCVTGGIIGHQKYENHIEAEMENARIREEKIAEAYASAPRYFKVTAEGKILVYEDASRGKILASKVKGDRMQWTKNTTTGVDGTEWYEVYYDNDSKETGWITNTGVELLELVIDEEDIEF